MRQERATGFGPPLRRRLRRLPLRLRLIALVLVLLVSALALSGIVTGVLLRNYLLDRTDDELRVYAEPAAALAYQQIVAGVTPAYQPNYTVRFISPDGTQQLAAPVDAVTEDGQPDIPRLTLGDRRVQESTPFTVESVPGQPPLDWRVVAGVNQQRDAIYAVAVPLRGLEGTVEKFLFFASLIGLAVLVTGGIVAWYAVRRAFGPLTEIEDTAAAIAAGDLTQRVPERTSEDEVASLARSLNSMLSQIEQSFAVREASEERMRQFVADASHELRTPLATVRGYAELYRQGAVREPDDIAGAMQRIESEASRMSGLVEDLLLLARLDGERPLEHEDVDLAVLAGDATQDARVLDPSRPIRLTGLGRPLGPVHVVGDEGRLRQLFTNLMGNALNHTPPGTPIEVAVGQRAGGGAAIEVRDHGPGIDPPAVARVFERFYRADPSRARSGRGGNGLGLAIVAAVVQAHRGKVGVARTPGGGATFVVELPQVAHSRDPAVVDARVV